MTAERRRDERLNVIALLAALLLLPFVVGALTLSWVAVLITYALTQLFVIGCVLFIVESGKRVES